MKKNNKKINKNKKVNKNNYNKFKNKPKSNKITKSECKYYDVGNCNKFHCRCFDCKEYNKNIDYLESIKSKEKFKSKEKKTTFKNTWNRIVCKDTKEIANSYNDYLSTKHWDKMKNKIRTKYNYTCQMCHKNLKDDISKLHVHHLTYSHIGNERINDLILLCEKCHSDIHKV